MGFYFFKLHSMRGKIIYLHDYYYNNNHTYTYALI